MLARLAAENPAFHRAIVEIQLSVELRERETPDAAADSEPAAGTTPPTTAKSGRAPLLREFSLRQLPQEKEAAVQAAAATLNLAEAERLLTGTPGMDDLAATLERQRTDAVRFLSRWFRDPKQPPFAAVLGEIGSGKTTMLQMLARALSKDAPHDTPPVFFVDLRDYIGDANPTLEHLLADQLRRHDRSGKLTVRDLTDAVQTGGGLIVFDGLDEKNHPARRRSPSALHRRAVPRPAAGRDGPLGVVGPRAGHHLVPFPLLPERARAGQRLHRPAARPSQSTRLHRLLHAPVE